MLILYYTISWVINAFWSVLLHDILESRCIDDVIMKSICFFSWSDRKQILKLLLQVGLFSYCNRSQMTSKCGETKTVAASVSLNVLATFLWLCRPKATWNSFVKYLISYQDYNCINVLCMHINTCWTFSHFLQECRTYWWNKKPFKEAFFWQLVGNCELSQLHIYQAH